MGRVIFSVLSPNTNSLQIRGSQVPNHIRHFMGIPLQETESLSKKVGSDGHGMITTSRPGAGPLFDLKSQSTVGSITIT